MANSIDQIAVDLQSLEFRHGVEQHFWELAERTGSLLYVWLYAPDNHAYLVELDCDCYGTEPIKGLFVDPVTRQCISAAWPRGNPVFAQWVKFEGSESDLFICWDQDRGGIQRHSEWRQRAAWTTNRNQLVTYLDFLRGLLHVPAKGYIRHASPRPA